MYEAATGNVATGRSANITADEFRKIVFSQVGLYYVTLTATNAAPVTVQVEIYTPTPTTDNTNNNDDDDDDTPTVVVPPTEPTPEPTEPEDTEPGDDTNPDDTNPGGTNTDNTNPGDGTGTGGSSDDSDSGYYDDSENEASYTADTSGNETGTLSATLPNGAAVTGVFDADTGMWTIFDENGTPLGSVFIPEGKTLEEVLLEGEMLPLGANAPGDVLQGDRGGTQKSNPKTGDTAIFTDLGVIISLGALLAAASLYVRRTRKKMTAR